MIHQYWNHAFKPELKARLDDQGGWQSVLKHTGTLGGPPILDFDPVCARSVRLEFGKFGSYPLELSELCLFPPLEELKK